MASLAVWSNGCSRYKTRQHGLLLELVDVTSSLQCWGSFIGCLWDRELTSNWRCWCTSLSTRPHSAVSVGRLSTRHGGGTSTSQVIGRLRVCSAADTVTDRWQMVLWNNLPVELREWNQFRTSKATFVCLCGSLAQCALSLKRLSAGPGSNPQTRQNKLFHDYWRACFEINFSDRQEGLTVSSIICDH